MLTDSRYARKRSSGHAKKSFERHTEQKDLAEDIMVRITGNYQELTFMGFSTSIEAKRGDAKSMKSDSRSQP